jgi:aminoglycoside phosphotransferase (APT) family kinase protein
VHYEAEVYRTVLKPIGCSTPVFYGHYTDPNSGTTWLIIEYVESCQQLNWGPIPQVLVDAARWLANFHAASEVLLSSDPPQGLNTYDREYYIGWARRASQFAGPLHGRFPWFKAFCERFEKLADALLEAPQTVIHGEFYQKNVLIRNGTISPIDWESAAVAAGQIDLTALTEGWPADTVAECELAYQRARWPEGAPAGFDHMLDAARIYLHLRWLGDRPSWTMLKSSQRHFEQLRLTGEKCGLI